VAKSKFLFALDAVSSVSRAEDLVFANRTGKPINRRNLLNRQVKPTAKRLGLPKEIEVSLSI
jgi:hypothetical protein